MGHPLKTLVTGASGFIGRKLLNCLQDRGLEVRVVLRAGSDRSLHLPRKSVEVVEVSDLFAQSTEQLCDLLRGIDLVVHAAWNVAPSDYLTSLSNLKCLLGSVRLGQAFAEVGGKRFVGLGTCYEYDLSNGSISRSTPLIPHTLYGASKAATFHSLSRIFERTDTEFLWCRLFYVYGDGDHGKRLVPYIRQQLASGQPALLGSGTQIRDFLDVHTAAELIVNHALSSASGAVNICSGYPRTIRAFAEQVADEYGRRDLLIFGAKMDSPDEPKSVYYNEG